MRATWSNSADESGVARLDEQKETIKARESDPDLLSIPYLLSSQLTPALPLEEVRCFMLKIIGRVCYSKIFNCFFMISIEARNLARRLGTQHGPRTAHP
ncbi:hypothetical protein AGR6A_pTi0180 [Agrobacterium sp. NCPPB 925]|nr:hypothetical protein AGR6A_pTi0180 [Agrobacterium sp. NCPPB 925]